MKGPDTEEKGRWGVFPRVDPPHRTEDPFPEERERWFRNAFFFLASTLFLEIGFVLGYHYAQPPVNPYEIRPLPALTCPDGTVVSAP